MKGKIIFQGSVTPKSFSLPESGQVAGSKEENNGNIGGNYG
jgi:hypothetical protein